MNKKNLIVILPIMLALSLTGCDKQDGSAPGPSIPAVITTSSPADTFLPAPVSETSLAEPTTPTDAELEAVVKSYNEEVSTSNDKAKDVLEAYTGQIESGAEK